MNGMNLCGKPRMVHSNHDPANVGQSTIPAIHATLSDITLHHRPQHHAQSASAISISSAELRLLII